MSETSLGFFTHLESTADGSRHAVDRLQGHHGGRPLLARYDLAGIRKSVSRDDIERRAPDLWRYAELLPGVPDSARVSLGEGMTPLLPCPRLGAALGVPRLSIKDESQLPTGSFKARGMALAVTMAKALGATRLATPTAGNAGGAMAAYAARAGLEAWVFMPDDTPEVNRLECLLHGARTFLVDGLIHDCGALVKAGIEPMGWFDVSTMKEPYRLEGKKTMGLELAEQRGWRLPDAIFYPTGGGTGLIGMWKAFAELEALGWLEATDRPRMYAVQAEGCAPIPAAFAAGADRAGDVADPRTAASGLRVPKAFADFMILDAVRASGGKALAAPEASIGPWMRRAMELEGIALCPEAAVCLHALDAEVRAGALTADDEVVVFNTGSAQKYVEVMRDAAAAPMTVGRDAVDWDALRRLTR